MLLGLSYLEIAIAVGAFVVSTLVSSGIVAWFLIAIPADHFIAETRGLSTRMPSPLVRGLYLTGKNMLGALLVIVGIVLALPGVPGQGLLTILVGVLLMDIPRKREIVLRIVRRDAIRRNIDRLRARFSREPLVLSISDAVQHEDIVDS